MSGPQYDFAGKNGYIWFVGVVEARNDPAKMGRLRVRIIGWHDENTNLLPTEDLPWAEISVPVNSSRNLSLPKEGEWVHGFFKDGEAGQQPIITGVIPGIISKTPKTPTGATSVLTGLEARLVIEQRKLDAMISGQIDSATAQKRANQQTVIDNIQKNLAAATEKRDRLSANVSKTLLYAPLEVANKEVASLQASLASAQVTLSELVTTYTPKQIETQRQVVTDLKDNILLLEVKLSEKTPYGFQDTRTTSDVDKGPVTPDGVVADRKNEPSVPVLTRTIDKTGRELSNKNREHVCDFADYVRQGMAAAKVGTSVIAQAIRKALQALIKALSPSPGGSALAEQIRSITKQINRAVSVLKEINEGIATFTIYVQKINALIQYILSLPADILAMFKQCLSEAYAELQKGVMLIVGDFSDLTKTEGTDFSEITKEAKAALSATKELLTNTAKLYSAPAQILGALTNPTKPLTAEEAKTLISGMFPDSKEHDITSYEGIF